VLGRHPPARADPAYEDFVTALARRARAIRLGNGLDPDTESGPLVSATQPAKVERYGPLSVEQGARLLARGPPAGRTELAQGFFYLPTAPPR
jgi:betaine-aldehyde dehydrogenase